MHPDLEHITKQFHRISAEGPEPDALAPYIQDGKIVLPDGLSEPQRARFACYAGDIAQALGAAGLAVGAFEQLVAMEEAQGEPPRGLANSYVRLGASRAAAGDLEAAARDFGVCVALLDKDATDVAFVHYRMALAFSNAEDYGRAGPSWHLAYTNYYAEGNFKAAATTRLSMLHDLLQMAKTTYHRGEAAIAAGAAEAVLAELADQFLAMTMAVRDMTDAMLSDPDLLPHAAHGRVYLRTELFHAFTARGDQDAAIEQLRMLAEHPDTSEADRLMYHEHIAGLRG